MPDACDASSLPAGATGHWIASPSRHRVTRGCESGKRPRDLLRGGTPSTPVSAGARSSGHSFVRIRLVTSGRFHYSSRPCSDRSRRYAVKPVDRKRKHTSRPIVSRPSASPPPRRSTSTGPYRFHDGTPAPVANGMRRPAGVARPMQTPLARRALDLRPVRGISGINHARPDFRCAVRIARCPVDFFEPGRRRLPSAGCRPPVPRDLPGRGRDSGSGPISQWPGADHLQRCPRRSSGEWTAPVPVRGPRHIAV